MTPFLDHLKYQIESGVFSEGFETSGGVTFSGILDNSHVQDDKDDGNVRQKTRKCRIMVAEVPAAVEEGTVILYVDGADRTVTEIDLDDKGVPTIWLL